MPNETIAPQDSVNAPQADETTPRVEEATADSHEPVEGAERSKANEEAKRYRLKAKELKNQLANMQTASRLALDKAAKERDQIAEERDQAYKQIGELSEAMDELKYRTLAMQIKAVNALVDNGVSLSPSGLPMAGRRSWGYTDKAHYSMEVIDPEALEQWLADPSNLRKVEVDTKTGLSVDELLALSPKRLNTLIAKHLYANARYMMKLIQPSKASGLTIHEATRSHGLQASNMGYMFDRMKSGEAYW
ncbi:hypothetical protein [Alloscardovia macacae]|uniref:Uncharacterized protein n=1 Tax=Alloscardovia macacae TaxID=1160091 RepID=A0A261F4R2_9BIFI|nr:hypothetical protein [Alloscardovia macacae]OZG54065.1 hypothetical protein ALMA_1029 [Alloscardovia macacae]